MTPTELQLELLSTYAVDLLPEEVMCAAGYSPEPALDFAAQVRYESRWLMRSRLAWFGAVGLIVAFFLLRALGG